MLILRPMVVSSATKICDMLCMKAMAGLHGSENVSPEFIEADLSGAAVWLVLSNYHDTGLPRPEVFLVGKYFW